MPPKSDSNNFSIDHFMTPSEFVDFVGDVKRVVRFVDALDQADIKVNLKLASEHEVILRGREDKPGLLTRIDRVERIVSVMVWIVTIITVTLVTGGIAFIGFLLTHGGSVFVFPGVK